MWLIRKEYSSSLGSCNACLGWLFSSVVILLFLEFLIVLFPHEKKKYKNEGKKIQENWDYIYMKRVRRMFKRNEYIHKEKMRP